jgi:hypothetical protein
VEQLMTDIRKRIHGPCSVRLLTKKTDDVDFNIGLFFQRLLLFDTYIMAPIRLMEIPHLVRLIGYDAVVEIMNSGILKFDLNTSNIAEISSLKASKLPQRKGVVKLNSYSFSTVAIADDKEHVSNCLKCISSIPGIDFKQKKKLKRLIAQQIIPSDNNLGKLSLENLRADILSNKPILKSTFVHKLKNEKNITLNVDELELKFNKALEKDDFDCESNLSTILKIDDMEAHNLIQSSLLGVGAINRRIENMRHFNSLSGFMNDDVQLFEEKLSFLERLISHDNNIKEFNRVISITGLPSFNQLADGSIRIDIEKFLKIRDSDECRNFRDWIGDLSDVSDEEIKEHTLSLKTKLSTIIHSSLGETLRFVATTALGPLGAGEALSIGVDALDNFLLDKVMPNSGIAAFIHNSYPSIFDSKK